MDKLSLDDYLKEMAKKRQTFNWDALLVFDRSKTNILLMQQYIDRFDECLYFPPESNCIPIVEGVIHVLEGLALDKPRLSFENANLSDSRARLTLRMVGGKQIQFNHTVVGDNVIRKPTRLSTINAVAGPSLLMNIQLKAASGDVDSDGRVILDISQGTDHEFTGVETRNESVKIGLHLEAMIAKWEKRLTEFQLSDLVISEESLLQPKRFAIRTHGAPQSKVRGTQAYGDGAVVVFVAMKDNEKQLSLPEKDSDMLYMLPEATPSYSSNMILGHEFLWSKVIATELNKIDFLKAVAIEEREEAGTQRREYVATRNIVYAGGRLPGPNPQGWTDFPNFEVKATGEHPLRIRLENNTLQLRWVSNAISTKTHSEWFDASGRGGQYDGAIELDVDVEATYAFTSKEIDDRTVIRFEPLQLEDRSNFKLTMSGDEPVNGWGEVRRFIEHQYEDVMGLIEKFKQQLGNPAATLDAFRLNNLLFPGDNVVTLRDANWPLDLTLLGDLAPELTTLVVSPAEVVVPAQTTRQFTVEGAEGRQVTWSAANVPGQTGAFGEIDPATGRYVAPDRASLRDSGARRVIITATSGDYVSKALVHLVESEVSVYPSALVASFGTTYSLVAGAADGGKLRWALSGAELGELLEGSELDAEAQDGRKYKAPNQLPPYQAGNPISHYYARLDQVVVAPEAGGEDQTIDILILGAQSGTYWLEAEEAGESIQLRFYYTNLSFEKVEVKADEAKWELIKGSGTLSDTVPGLYTPKADSTEQYAIITAIRWDGESADRFAYMILPVPFVSSKRFIQLLDDPCSGV